jgi:hypothetical protein
LPISRSRAKARGGESCADGIPTDVLEAGVIVPEAVSDYREVSESSLLSSSAAADGAGEYGRFCWIDC